MTTPICQGSGPLREWAPLTTLLQKIPCEIHTGLFTQDINLTCIDVVPEFIAIGTNHGLIYWFDRKNGDVETLKCKDAHCTISCIQIVSTVDYMIAAGNNEGVITIFQIPKPIPESLPENLKPKKKRQIERFSISDLHKSPVTTIEWSKNGMKLFSGDQNGLVIMTEIDYYLHLSKSMELINEKYSVVQLSYKSGLLLVSTLFRTLILDREQNNKVTQVGQKERKTFGKFGAVFLKSENLAQKQTIYATRPGLRIWQADKSGNVLKTLILKEAVKAGETQIKLLNPAPYKVKKKLEDSFGIIKSIFDDLLLTYNEDLIYIINPNTTTVTSTISELRKVTDVACSNDEVFILEGERNIIRIACYPEKNNYKIDEAMNQSTSKVELLQSVTSKLSGLTTKLKSTNIVPAIPFENLIPPSLGMSTSLTTSFFEDKSSPVGAEEAIEIPPIVPLELDTSLVTGIDALKNQIEQEKEEVKRKNIFKKIGEQSFEEVVFSSPKGKISACIITEPESPTIINKKNNSTENEVLVNKAKGDFIGKSKKMFESERTLESIQKAIQDKEKRLSDFLSLDLSKYIDKSSSSNSSLNSSLDSSQYANDVISYLKPDLFEQTTDLNIDQEAIKQRNTQSNSTYVNKSVTCNEIKNENSWPSDIHDAKDDTISEAHFIALSKEFVKTTVQDTDDWILLG